ncbi:MAG: hypothetical protein ACYS8X_04120 [Planctomycetota bacterium]
MNHPYDPYLRRASAMVHKLMILAEEGDEQRQDDQIGILVGVLRDCAFKIRREVKHQNDAHTANGRQLASQKG